MIRLKSIHVTDYKSIRDGNKFEIGDVTCLVGKNESGKTATLEAIYRLNPIVPDHAKFDVTDDYPRMDVEDYEQGIEDGKQHATVVRAEYELEDALIKVIESELGEGVLPNKSLELSKGYANILDVTLSPSQQVACKKLVSEAGLPDDLSKQAQASVQLTQLAELLAKHTADRNAAVQGAKQQAAQIADETQKQAAIIEADNLAAPSQVAALQARIKAIQDNKGLNLYIWNTHVRDKVPRFLYFDQYYQTEGHLNIQKLKQREAENRLLDSDRPMLGLIELARLNLDQLIAPKRTEQLIAKLEGASNHLSKQILKYWSQNKHLHVRFDVRPGNPEDPEGMREGTNLWGRVFDSVHEVTTLLGTRSKGFLWFFSFLAWFSQQKKQNEPLILLLDEPGLFLHAMAQGDLLRYIEHELKPHHQVIYTTHSPFMVDPHNFYRVRVVEDKSIDSDGDLPDDQKGTKVLSDPLEAAEDSLFPLQGALGFDISQTLFVGPNSLIVEGVSDLLYIQVMTRILNEQGRVGLSSKWVVTPVGGSDKVPTFVALLGAQKCMKVATFIDIADGDRQRVENLYKRKLLKKKNVCTFSDFTGKNESDIEDMFDEDFYLKLVNGEFASDLQNPITPADIAGSQDRVLVRLDLFIDKNPIQGTGKFNHYRPARYFVDNETALKGEVSSGTLDRFERAFKALNALL